MSRVLNNRLAFFSEGSNFCLLKDCLNGIEREALRVTEGGFIALTPHPIAFGSPLTNRQITTDYSEALIELITPASENITSTLETLKKIHCFAYENLSSEVLWNSSMPCVFDSHKEVPIAYYGISSLAETKHVYRKGLALRYGQEMQCIAGVHYNFSFAQKIWRILEGQGEFAGISEDFQSSFYLSLIRNFYRYSWLLVYLFGASPVIDKSFFRNYQKKIALDRFDDQTLYLPYSTSLRMSKYGYQSSAQAKIIPSYNTLDSYTSSILKAISTSSLYYTKLGLYKHNKRVQLNTNILQLENEHYSSIRPKRITLSGESPLQALVSRGIQYVEVRLLDINPFEPTGLDEPELYFINVFLIYCAMQESKPMDRSEYNKCCKNFRRVVLEGRKPGLALEKNDNSKKINMAYWGLEMMKSIAPIADLLDKQQDSKHFTNAVNKQVEKIEDVSLTPSFKVLDTMIKRNESFNEFCLRKSKEHQQFFSENQLSAKDSIIFAEEVKRSILQRKEIESENI